MSKRTVLAWVDLETTGLDSKNGRILEYAVVFTDPALDELGSTQGVVPQDVAGVRALMDDYCTKMHTDNGLLAELEAIGASDVMTYEEHARVVEIQLMQVFQNMRSFVSDGVDDVIFVIAGSTIGFDRGWLKDHMPELEAMFHYRQLDVSSYKVGFPEIFGSATSEAHRAMPDIRESIAKHQKMRDIVAFASTMASFL